MGGNQHMFIYHFVDPDLVVEIFFEKRRRAIEATLHTYIGVSRKFYAKFRWVFGWQRKVT